jgi:hypothetical protein
MRKRTELEPKSNACQNQGCYHSGNWRLKVRRARAISYSQVALLGANVSQNVSLKLGQKFPMNMGRERSLREVSVIGKSGVCPTLDR